MPFHKINVKQCLGGTFRIIGGFLLFMMFFVVFSCSLEYNSARKAPLSPELVLYSAEFRRVENSKPIALLNADILESYRADNSLFGSGVAFEMYEEDGSVSARGSAALFFADQKNDLFSLLSGANILSLTHDVQISAENLKWNNKTEQLTAAKNDEVSITRGGFGQSKNSEQEQTFTVRGRGFSADGAKQDFTFTEYVSGVIKENALSGENR